MLKNKYVTMAISFLIAFTIAMLLAPIVSAQGEDKNTIAVTGVYNRSGVTLKDIRNEDFKYNADRDSVGFGIEYERAVVGPFGMGMQAVVTFHDKDVSGVTSCGPDCTITSTGRSKIALASFDYFVQLQDRKGSFQPFARALAGVQRTAFGGTTFIPNVGEVNVHGGSQFYYGFAGGADVKVAKKTFLRFKATATQAFSSDTSQWNVRPEIGLAFRF